MVSMGLGLAIRLARLHGLSMLRVAIAPVHFVVGGCSLGAAHEESHGVVNVEGGAGLLGEY